MGRIFGLMTTELIEKYKQIIYRLAYKLQVLPYAKDESVVYIMVERCGIHVSTSNLHET